MKTRNHSSTVAFAATICMLFVVMSMTMPIQTSASALNSQTEAYYYVSDVGTTAVNFIETQTAGSFFSGAQMEVAKVGTVFTLQAVNITGQNFYEFYANGRTVNLSDKSVQKAAMEMMQNQGAIQRLSGTMMQSIGVTATNQNAMSQVMKWTAAINTAHKSSTGAIMMPWTATTTMKGSNLVMSSTYNLSAEITTSLATQATTASMMTATSATQKLESNRKVFLASMSFNTTVTAMMNQMFEVPTINFT